MTARPHSAAHVLVIAWVFSFVGVFTAVAFDGHTSTLAVIAVRAVAVAIILGIYLKLAGVRLALPANEMRIACALGVVLAVNNYTLTAAIERIPVPLAIMLFYLWPALTAIVSTLSGAERTTSRTFAGLALSFIGIALALRVHLNDAEMIGVLFAIGSSVAWTVMVLLIGRFVRQRDSRPYTFWMTATTAALFTLIIITIGSNDFTLPATARGWFGLAALPFVYALALIGFYAASASLGPVKTGFYMNFEPISSVIMSALVLGQMLTAIQLAGAALVIAALFLYRPMPPRRAAST